MADGKIVAIGKPFVADEDKKSMLEGLQHMTELIDKGESTAMLCIAIAPDRSFKIFWKGDVRMNEALGLLERAKYDLISTVERAEIDG